MSKITLAIVILVLAGCSRESSVTEILEGNPGRTSSQNLRISSCAVEGSATVSKDNEKMTCKDGLWVTSLDQLRKSDLQFQPANVGVTWKTKSTEAPLKCKEPESKFRVLYESHRGTKVTREATYVCANKASVFTESGMSKLQENLLKSTDSNMVLIENLLAMTN